jgi:hypothetical protein
MTGQGTDRGAFCGTRWLLVGTVRRVGGDGKTEQHGSQNDTSHRVFPSFEDG